MFKEWNGIYFAFFEQHVAAGSHPQCSVNSAFLLIMPTICPVFLFFFLWATLHLEAKDDVRHHKHIIISLFNKKSSRGPVWGLKTHLRFVKMHPAVAKPGREGRSIQVLWEEILLSIKKWSKSTDTHTLS